MNAISEILLQALNRRPEWRKGQAIYNYAQAMYPDIVKKMDPGYDCFYRDELIEKFLEELEKQIEKNQK